MKFWVDEHKNDESSDFLMSLREILDQKFDMLCKKKGFLIHLFIGELSNRRI